MMSNTEIQVYDGGGIRVKQYCRRIEKLFSVVLDVKCKNSHSDIPFSTLAVGGVGSSTTGSHSTGPKSIITVVIAGKKANTSNAKRYIQSLTANEHDKKEVRLIYNAAGFRLLQEQHDNLEQDSQAILNFHPDSRALSVWGLPSQVATARDCIDKMLISRGIPTHRLVVAVKSTSSTEDDEDASHRGLAIQNSLSPSNESNHDSCYDSDGSENTRQGELIKRHSDASRTWSDTLRAEHTDSEETDGTFSSRDPAAGLLITELNKYKETQEYINCREKIIRMGYNEEDLDHVLMVKGLDISYDLLVQELITVSNVKTVIEKPYKESLSRKSSAEVRSGLRPIVIDGSNVAKSHGGESFSWLGIELAVKFFRNRGHKDIQVVLPKYRKEVCRTNSVTSTRDNQIREQLESEKVLFFTPSRTITTTGKRIICYDDPYIIQLAAEKGGVVVSNDNYRDVAKENPNDESFKQVIDQRLLMYNFNEDSFLVPNDPMGRSGPRLDEFLSFDQPIVEKLCPFMERCTYGHKCKYAHPEKGSDHRYVTQKLKDDAESKLKEKVAVRPKLKLDASKSVSSKQPLTRKKALAFSSSMPIMTSPRGKQPLGRTESIKPPLHRTDAKAPSVVVTRPTDSPKQANTSGPMTTKSNGSKPQFYFGPHPAPHQSVRETYSDPSFRDHLSLAKRISDDSCSSKGNNPSKIGPSPLSLQPSRSESSLQKQMQMPPGKHPFTIPMPPISSEGVFHGNEAVHLTAQHLQHQPQHPHMVQQMSMPFVQDINGTKIQFQTVQPEHYLNWNQPPPHLLSTYADIQPNLNMPPPSYHTTLSMQSSLPNELSSAWSAQGDPIRSDAKNETLLAGQGNKQSINTFPNSTLKPTIPFHPPLKQNHSAPLSEKDEKSPAFNPNLSRLNSTSEPYLNLDLESDGRMLGSFDLGLDDVFKHSNDECAKTGSTNSKQVTSLNDNSPPYLPGSQLHGQPIPWGPETVHSELRQFGPIGGPVYQEQNVNPQTAREDTYLPPESGTNRHQPTLSDKAQSTHQASKDLMKMFQEKMAYMMITHPDITDPVKLLDLVRENLLDEKK